MKMRKILAIILSLAILISCAPMTVTAQTTINIGDYLQMGTYYGEPILWRCVDVDKDDALMLADRILCLKPFDAHTPGNSTGSSHSRGNRSSYCSNYWADSNIRSWLNSEESAGNVQWLCGNPPDKEHVYKEYNAYDTEAGFLTNFSDFEKRAIKEVTQKSLLADVDKSIEGAEGSAKHTLSTPINDVVKNYANAYSEQVTDKMFLLDVQQINMVYDNANLLGENYHIGKPTAKAVENSEYQNVSLAADKDWYSWLRSPNANSPNAVRYVAGANVESKTAFYGDVGIRPAFYYNLSSLSVAGEGTAENPYYPHEHTLTYHEAVSATCTEDGNCEYWECESGCNKIFSDENGAREIAESVIPATGHTEETDEGVEPTCTETGKTEGKHCSVCDEIIEAQEEIPATGHAAVIDEGVEPTCTEAGKTEGSHCSVCDEVITEQEDIPAKNHAWNDWVVEKEPTETEAGVGTRTCKSCGASETGEIPALTYSVKYDGENAVVTVLEAGTYTVIFAAYDEYGRLLSAEMQTAALEAGKNPPVLPQSLNINGASTVKVMLWDSIDGMKPFAMTEKTL